MLTPDGIHYASLGKNIIELGTYHSNGSHFPDVIQPPLFPLIISLFYLVTKDPFISGFLVSSLFRALAIIPLFYLALKFFDRKTAITTSLLFIAHPLIFDSSILISTQPIYCFAFLLIVYLIFTFFQKMTKRGALLIGIGIGLAYCIRVEAFLLFIIFLSLLIFGDIRFRKKWRNIKYVFFCLIGLLIIYLPLTIFVYRQSNIMMPCPKIQLILAHKKIWMASESDSAFHHSSYTMKYQRAIFKYSPETNNLLANDILFNRKVDLPARPLSVNTISSGETSRFVSLKNTMKLIIHYFEVYFKNLLQLYRTINHVRYFPPLLLPVLILGLIGQAWTEKCWKINISLFWVIAVSSVFLFSHFSTRFFIPIVAITMLWCAQGITRFSQLIIDSFKHINLTVSNKLMLSLIVGVILLSMVPSWISVSRFNEEQMNGFKKIAKSIEAHVPSDAVVISRLPQSSYLAKRHYAALPYLDFDELLKFTCKFSNCALVLSKQDESLRPELSNQLWHVWQENKLNSHKIIFEDDCAIVLFNHNN